MKKQILAIFLCLILTVSLATAVAAKNDVITPGGTYTVTDNPSQPEPDDTPVPNDTTMTLEIPITKVVTLGGNTAPQRTTFTFNARPSDPRYGLGSSNTGLWDVRNCTVSVNGEGTFNCVMTIRIEKEDFHFLTDKEGIIITETDDEQPTISATWSSSGSSAVTATERFGQTRRSRARSLPRSAAGLSS